MRKQKPQDQYRNINTRRRSQCAPPRHGVYFQHVHFSCRPWKQVNASQRRLHGSCVSKDGDAILLLGPSGSGKSDLVLRLLSHGFELVADDQVTIADGYASGPPELAGLLEG